ncbi:MAG: DUF1634 domain-containing protein [Thermomicrobiales bacterium]|nr:DUF1634 domain-containing protein [Thermomicrobiales bacterium]
MKAQQTVPVDIDDDVDPELENLYERIAKILAIGFWASIVVIVAGLIVALVRGQDILDTTLRMESVVGQAIRLNGSAMVDLGLLGLLLTPLAYVVAALLTFVRQRDRLFVAVCVALLLLFAATVGLAVL